jgi:hypothetical protein
MALWGTYSQLIFLLMVSPFFIILVSVKFCKK